MANHDLKTYGLIGHPLVHSFSQRFFSAKFEREQLPARYLNFDVPTEPSLRDELKEILAAHPSLAGFNVTIPYKQKIMPLLDSIDSQATEIGAVNVVKVSRNESGTLRLTGHNTDHIGFSESIKPFLKPHHKHALILGSGGAAKSVAYGLARLGLTHTIVSRSPSENGLTYAQLSAEVMRHNTVIVNTTPLGTYPDTESYPPIPYNLLTSEHLCFDLVYNPSTTAFMRLASQHGAKTENGAEMLRIQALEAWKIWNS